MEWQLDMHFNIFSGPIQIKASAQYKVYVDEHE